MPAKRITMPDPAEVTLNIIARPPTVRDIPLVQNTHTPRIGLSRRNFLFRGYGFIVHLILNFAVETETAESIVCSQQDQ